MNDRDKKLRRKPPVEDCSKRGAVLIAVLAIILLITFIVTRFMNEAMEDLEYRAIFNEPADVRSYAYSMLEVALATLQEVALIDDGKLYAGEQGWSDPIKYAEIDVPNGWSVEIKIRDEGGKISLNHIEEPLLNRLLEEELDFDFGTARELSSTLFDWIDDNDQRRLNGAESDDYLNNNPPYRAANRPLQSLEELRLLKIWEDEFFDEDGLPNESFKRLSSMVSVLDNDEVNLNAAPEPVLDIFSLVNGWQKDDLFNNSLEQPYLKNAPASNESGSGVEIRLLRVTVTLFRGEVPFTISALVKSTFNSGNVGIGRNNPGRSSSQKEPKTGSIEEQNQLSFPFRIIELNEYTQAGPEIPSGRNSALDIGK